MHFFPVLYYKLIQLFVIPWYFINCIHLKVTKIYINGLSSVRMENVSVLKKC